MHKIIRLSSLLFCLALFSHCNRYRFQHPNNMDRGNNTHQNLSDFIYTIPCEDSNSTESTSRGNNPHQLLSDLIYTFHLEDNCYNQLMVLGVKLLGNFSLPFLGDSINRLAHLECMLYSHSNKIDNKEELRITLEIVMRKKTYLPNLFFENEELKKIILLNFYRQYLFEKKDIKSLDKLFEENSFLVNFPTFNGEHPISYTLRDPGNKELRDYLLNHKNTQFDYSFYGIRRDSFTTLLLKRNYISLRDHRKYGCNESCYKSPQFNNNISWAEDCYKERQLIINYPNLLLEYPILNPSLRGMFNLSSPLLSIFIKLNDLAYSKANWDTLIRILLSQADKNVFNDIFEGLLRVQKNTESLITSNETLSHSNPGRFNFLIGEVLNQFYKHNKETKRKKAILQNVLRKKGHNKKIISLVKQYAGPRKFKLDPKRVLKFRDKLFLSLFSSRKCQLLLTANTICACCKKSEKELAKSSPNSEIELLRCSKCKCAYYCSKKCQRKDFKHHKKECISIEEIRKLRKNKQICQNCLILNKKDYVDCESCSTPSDFKVVVPTHRYKEILYFH